MALKIDVIGLEKILFAGMSMHRSSPEMTGWGSEGFNVSPNSVSDRRD